MPRFVRTIPMLLALGVFALVRVVPASAQPAEEGEIPTAKPAQEASPLLKEPQTPEELFSATLLMADLARLDLARKYLSRFVDGAPDSELLLQLRDRFGTADFVRLSLIPELRPISTDLLTQLETAARTHAADPAFVADLISKLEGTAVERELAIRELTNLGPDAVVPLMQRLRDPKSNDQRDLLVYTLIRMGRQVVKPVLGALESSDDQVRTAAINVVGWLRATEAVPFLWYPAFGPDQSQGVQIAAAEALGRIRYGKASAGSQLSSVEAAAELQRMAKAYFQQRMVLEQEDDGQVPVWTWDAQNQTIVRLVWSQRMANLWYATRFARESLAISPDVPTVQQQFLAALLGLEVETNGIDQPLPNDPGSPMYLAMTAGEAALSAVLADAIEARQTGTALAAVRGLSEVGTRELLVSKPGTRAPVLAALNYPDDRVQFESAIALLRQDPRLPFTGSDRVVEVLRRGLQDNAGTRVIVIDADTTRSIQTKGILNTAGYQVDIFRTGREGFISAAESGAVDFVLIQINVARWDLSQTVANFRADSRTAAIPLALFGSEMDRGKLDRLIVQNAPAMFVAESPSEDDLLRQIRPGLASSTSTALTASERLTRRSVSSYWLAELANTGSRVFNLNPAEAALSGVAEDPQLSTNALIGLGGIGTVSAQQRLAEVALNPQMPEAMRIQAAQQLGQHIQRHGLLLTKAGVEDVLTGWKTSDAPRLKAALAAVIGSLQPNARVLSERLREFPWRSAAGQ